MSFNFSKAPRAALVCAGALLAMAGAAWASDCPADKVGTNVTPPGPMVPTGVTDTVISSIDLKSYGAGLDGRQFRMRRLVIQPGGIVPWHSHETRPANIYVISGTVTEYRSTCAIPIVHMAGDVTGEFGSLSHWWKNTGNKEAVLISADIFTDMPTGSKMKQHSEMDHGM